MNNTSSQANRWLLPDGVKELLPPQGRQVEILRRNLLDLYHSWGYDQVMPPLIEFIESLQVGTGNDLDVATFKVIDRITGRTLGIRADTTPQVARIDAHCLSEQDINRLCYANTVLHTAPSSTGASRSPLQVGAELYGHQGLDSDEEVICLMLETILQAGIKSPLTLDLGHVGIYKNLMHTLALPTDIQTILFNLLQAKALPDIDTLIQRLDLVDAAKSVLKALPSLCGDSRQLDAAIQVLTPMHKQYNLTLALEAIEYLRHIAARVTQQYPQISCYFDVAELRGYHYHTGVVFSVLTNTYNRPIAKGGRYDAIGQAFGRARPATGFSADIHVLAELANTKTHTDHVVYTPQIDQVDSVQKPLLRQKQNQLRQEGYRVITALSNNTLSNTGKRNRLVWQNDQWQLNNA